MTVELITSIVAIVVALISGGFSYMASTRSSRVEEKLLKIQSLKEKLDALEKVIASHNSIKEKSFSSPADKMVEWQEFILTTLKASPTLFFINGDEGKKLKDLAELLTFSVKAHSQDLVSVDKMGQKVLPKQDIFTKTVELISGFDSLLIKEQEDLHHKIDTLCIKG